MRIRGVILYSGAISRAVDRREDGIEVEPKQSFGRKGHNCTCGSKSKIVAVLSE